jgi:hypothetical protein
MSIISDFWAIALILNVLTARNKAILLIDFILPDLFVIKFGECVQMMEHPGTLGAGYHLLIK